MEDIELLELLKNSPHEGLAAVVKQYSAYVYKIAYTRLGRVCSREDIEEAVSDIFMRFFLASQNDDTEIRSICAYLAAVSQRHCINIFNRQIRRMPEIPLDEIDNIPCEDISAESNPELIDAVHKLGEPDSDIIIRRYYFGQPVSDIADDLNMKSNTVSKRLSRGLKRLKKILEEGTK